MIQLQAILEDTVLVASRSPGGWSLTVSRIPTQAETTVDNITDIQMGCVLALAFGGDEIPNAKDAYTYAETIMAKLTAVSPALRIIP
jgi:hypothetical protein